MRSIITSLCFILAFMSLNSCATILSKSVYPVQLNSSPDGAKVTIMDRDGIEVFRSTTPATAMLKSGNGFFKKASYRITFSKEGYQDKTYPLTATLDGWYFGNILVGGIIGLLIVDPATGAMYKLDQQYIDGNLSSEGSASLDSPQLKIYDISEIPKEWVSKMELVK
jgi:hypothetical protein